MSLFFENHDGYYENYKSQLKSAEWRKKRKSILIRDNYTCTKCQNEHLLKHSLPYYFHSDGINPIDKSQFFGIFLPLEDVKLFNIHYQAFKGIKEREKYIYYWHQVKSELYLAAIIEIENQKNIHYISDSLLEIHHTYYISGYMAYDYPDESLLTLCWHCHGEEHGKM